MDLGGQFAWIFQVALEAVKNQQTLAELSIKFELNPVVISKWKSEFLENLSATFEKSQQTVVPELDSSDLYSTIGSWISRMIFIKKLHELKHRDLRVQLVRPRTSKISIRKQCELLTVNRRRVYYKPIAEKPEKYGDYEHYRLIPHQTSYRRWKSIAYVLMTIGFIVGPKRFHRLFKIMGRNTIYRRKNLTKSRMRELNLFVNKPEDCPCQPSLLYRHHLYSHEKRLYVHYSNYWCIQSKDRWLVHLSKNHRQLK